MKSLYKEGKLVLTQKNIKRIQQYLDSMKVLKVAGMNTTAKPEDQVKGHLKGSRGGKGKDSEIENEY